MRGYSRRSWGAMPDLSRGTTNIRELCTHAEVEAMISRMADDIAVSRSQAPLAIVGIRTAGVPLAARIVKRLRPVIPGVLFGQLDCALYRDDGGLPAKSLVPLGSEITFDVDGCRVVLVDDVFFTGRTARAAIDQIMDFGRPARIELAVLVSRDHRQVPIVPDYSGISVDTDFHDHVVVELAEHHGSDRILIDRSAAPSV